MYINIQNILKSDWHLNTFSGKQVYLSAVVVLNTLPEVEANLLTLMVGS